MPIYEYKCSDCGYCFEQLVFSSDDSSGYKCPSCDSKKTEKLLSSFSCGSGKSDGISGESLSSGCGSSGGFS